jgi:hypothetical protein
MTSQNQPPISAFSVQRSAFSELRADGAAGGESLRPPHRGAAAGLGEECLRTAGAPTAGARWWLALLVGTVLAVVVNLYVFASDYVYVSSRLTFGYLPMGAMVPFAAFIMFVVPLVRLLAPRAAFTKEELVVIFAMTLVGSVFPTLSMVGFIPSVLATPYYFATPENQWTDYLLPHLPTWAFPTNEGGVMEWFFQGMPEGEAFPWQVWVLPLLWWTVLVAGIATATFCGTVILRKQWVERERLAFPLAQVPLEMVRPGKGWLPAFMENRLFWIGLGIPLFAMGWNVISFFEPTFPTFPIIHGRSYLRIGPGFPNLRTNVNLFVMGFAYLTPLEVLLSVWLFHFLAILQVGIQNQLGWTIGPGDIWSGMSPIITWQEQGAFLVFVGLSVWMAREHLRDVLRKAWGRRLETDDSQDSTSSSCPEPVEGHEPISYRTALVGLGVGVVLVAAWMHQVGMNWLTVLVYGLGFVAVYIGVGKIVAQCGLIYVRAPITPHTFAAYTLGPDTIGPAGLIAIASTFAIWCDNKPVLSTAMMHTHRVGDEIRQRPRVLTAATALACVVGFSLALFLTLHICYTKGGVTTGCWEIRGGNITFFGQYVRKIQNPAGPDSARLTHLGAGAAVMSVLTFLKYRLAWWPIHPIGFCFAGGWAISSCAFTIFLTWLIKAILLKIGGMILLRKARPFFLGLLLGYVLGVGLCFLVDVIWFPAHGHMIHHW